jgi:short-subunit dehydrogenase
MNTPKTVQEFAVITGASAGIGRELALQLASRGYSVALCARRKAELDLLAEQIRGRYGVETLVLPLDLAERGAAKSLYEQLQKKGVQVGVLVNNAGFGALGAFNSLNFDLCSEMVQVNCTTLTELCHVYFNHWIGMKKPGYIMNVASVAGFLPGPQMALYYATKSFVLSLSEALREEGLEHNIAVSALCPGPTPTEFQTRAKIDFSQFRLMQTPVEKVARDGLTGLFSGDGVVIPGLVNQLAIASLRWMPRSLVPKIVNRIQKTRA